MGAISPLRRATWARAGWRAQSRSSASNPPSAARKGLTGSTVGAYTQLVSTRSPPARALGRSEEHTSELQSRLHLVCRLLLEKKKKTHADKQNRHRSKQHY